MGRAEAEALALADGEAVIVTDRYSGYDDCPNRRRQWCWAHLKRDFQAIAERDGESGTIGADLLQSVEALMYWWGRYREGRLKHTTLVSYIKRHVKPPVQAALERGALCDHKATRGTCRHVLQRWDALWMFLRYEGMPITSNAAERALRAVVIHRKIRYGVRSEQGARFPERAFSACATSRGNGNAVVQLPSCAATCGPF